MRKSPDAFRTISEVAQDLDLPQHVLRFWETRFSQIKPMKRGGGRRYYRPDDVDLLRGIRHLLYDEGYTIKGVQRILKEQGVRHVIDAVDGGNASAGLQGHNDAAAELAPQTIEPSAPDMPISPAPVQHPTVHPQAHAQPVHSELPTPAPMARQVQQPAQAAAVVQAISRQSEQVERHQSVPLEGTPAAVHMQPTAPPQHHITPPQHQREALGENARIAEVQPQARQAVIAPEPAPAPATEPAFKVAGPAPQSALVQSGHARATQPQPQQPPSAEMPEQGLPSGLLDGEPKFLKGENASISVQDGQAKLLEEEQRSGFFSRLRGKSDQPSGEAEPSDSKQMGKDDVRRLQSTLFELLECKRILDQARSD